MEIELQLAISWYPTKFSVVRLDHIQPWFWPKRTHGNLKTNQVVATTIFYHPQSEQKSPLLKAAQMQLFNMKKNLYPHRNFSHSC